MGNLIFGWEEMEREWNGLLSKIFLHANNETEVITKFVRCTDGIQPMVVSPIEVQDEVEFLLERCGENLELMDDYIRVNTGIM